MTRRESYIPALFTFLTCGLYYFYWQYVTTEELKNTTGRTELNPMVDLLITILCCGVYGMYVQYRNAQIIHEVFQSRGVPHEDKSTMILIMHVAHAFTGMTSFIGILMMQDELNKLGDLMAGGGAFSSAPRAF
ncbi:MAG: DUF4234 domain-containing protein [Sandaracinaceae bacterium]|nr:DUF4234 domain-containing protein [Sandaracinaceae bacterium]